MTRAVSNRGGCQLSLLRSVVNERAQVSLRRLGRRVSLEKNGVLSAFGDPVVALVTEGWFRLTRYTSSGAALHTGPFGRGRFLGLEQMLCETESAPEISALTPAQAVTWEVQALRDLAANEPSLEQGAGRVLADALEETRRERLENLELNVSQRLVRLLERLCDGGLDSRLPVTQSDLAALLGVRRETVCTHMTRLEAQGVLRRQGRAWWFEPRGLAHTALMPIG
jgi:CRP/FNR family transcriptional regulator, cyclic AMP receptor protein